MKKTVALKTEPVATSRQATEASDFIDVAGAASLVFVSEATIRRRLTLHELTRYKFGSRTLLSRSEVLSSVKPEER